jgi:hypothetical protein
MGIWNILRVIWDIFDHLLHFIFIWYIFSGFVIMYKEKSGNPASNLVSVKSLLAFKSPCVERTNMCSM